MDLVMLKNITYSVIRNRCPKCHRGKVFESDNAYNLKTFSKIHSSCSCCGEKYEKEPGFYYGAMYVSYALTVAWFIVTFAINEFFIHANTAVYLIFSCSFIVLFAPLTFRLSRLLWLNFFISYDKTKADCQ